MATLQCSRCGGTRCDTSHRCEKGCGVMTATNEATLATLDGLRKRLEQLEAERDALAVALGPFAHAWRRRAPTGDPGSKAYRMRMDRALLPFLSNGNADESGVLTGEHLRAASAALAKSTTSLARRDARMKAEALHELLMFPRMGDEPVRAKAVKLRDGYRQQAEETQHGH